MQALGPAVAWKLLSFLCHLWTVWTASRFSGGGWCFRAGCGCSCILLAIFFFLFLKTVAWASFCHLFALWGWSTKSMLREIVIFALLYRLVRQLSAVSVLWFQIIQMFVLWSFPLVVQDFLLRAYPDPLLFLLLPYCLNLPLWEALPPNHLLGKCLCTMASVFLRRLSSVGVWGKWVSTGYWPGAVRVEVVQMAGVNIGLVCKKLQWPNKNNTHKQLVLKLLIRNTVL